MLGRFISKLFSWTVVLPSGREQWGFTTKEDAENWAHSQPHLLCDLKIDEEKRRITLEPRKS